MAKTIIHTGEFLSITGVLYRADIWRDNGIAGWWPESFGDYPVTPSASAGELRFEASEPLVLQWAETDKETPICASTATLNIESPGDRTYIDLYTIKAGAVGLDVYRDGKLYWRGTLDPESYEEPYERANLYPVSLTFSDFGMLDRVPFALPRFGGLITLQSLINSAARAAGLSNLPLDSSRMALTLDSGYNALSSLSCRADNFFDEDGKAQSYREALETMMQPCGLKLMQRAGKLWLFDLHGLSQANTREAVWSSDAQALGVDKVANSVILSFSPYAQSKLLDADDLKFPRRVSLSDAKNGASNTWLYYTDRTAQQAVIGQDRGRGLHLDLWDEENIMQEAEFVFAQSHNQFKILPLKGGGGATSGIVVRASQHIRGVGSRPRNEDAQIMASSTERLAYTTRRVYLPTVPNPQDLYIRIKMEALMDVRYNPFAETPDAKDITEDNNDRPTYNQARKGAAWCFAPLSVKLYAGKDDSAPYRHYSNTDIAYFATQNPLRRGGFMSANVDGWKAGQPGGWRTWLAYYPDPDQIREDSALMHGWVTNRPNIGRADQGGRTIAIDNNDHRLERQWDYDGDKGKGLYKWLQKISGELIPYPVTGGWLEISVGSGMVIHDYKSGDGANDGDAAPTGGEREFFDQKYWQSRQLFGKMQWLLYKAPEVDIVRAWGNYENIEVDDVETRATLHPDAREELKIDLKCGTLPDAEGEAVARGIYIDAQNHQPIRQLKRGGITDSPERLLINSLYSQYATRHTKLSGEAYIDAGDLCPYREANQGNKVFIASSTRQDLYMDCGDITLIELTPDKYQGITYQG